MCAVEHEPEHGALWRARGRRPRARGESLTHASAPSAKLDEHGPGRYHAVDAGGVERLAPHAVRVRLPVPMKSLLTILAICAAPVGCAGNELSGGDAGADANADVDADAHAGADAGADANADTYPDADPICDVPLGLAGHYAGTWTGLVNVDGDLAFSGTLAFDLTAPDPEFYEVSGQMTGQTDDGSAHFDATLHGELRCSRLRADLSVVVQEYPTLPATGEFVGDWNGSTFENGTWTGSVEGGAVTGSGVWSASP